MTAGSVPAFKAQYQAVLDARQAQFDAHFLRPDLAALHQKAHVRMLDVEKLFGLVANRREMQLYGLATSLLGDGLCQVASANYRLAFYCLRAFLELCSAAARFSAHEFELRQWQMGAKDVSWTVLSHEDSGVFGHAFAGAFYPPLKKESKHYLGLALRVYRECSEYVHANPSSHASSSIEVERSKSWFELADAAVTCVIYLYFVRYHSEVGPAIARDDEVKAILKGELGHFDGVSHAIERGVIQ